MLIRVVTEVVGKEEVEGVFEGDHRVEIVVGHPATRSVLVFKLLKEMRIKRRVQ